MSTRAPNKLYIDRECGWIDSWPISVHEETASNDDEMFVSETYIRQVLNQHTDIDDIRMLLIGGA